MLLGVYHEHCILSYISVKQHPHAAQLRNISVHLDKLPLTELMEYLSLAYLLLRVTAWIKKVISAWHLPRKSVEEQQGCTAHHSYTKQQMEKKTNQNYKRRHMVKTNRQQQHNKMARINPFLEELLIYTDRSPHKVGGPSDVEILVWSYAIIKPNSMVILNGNKGWMLQFFFFSTVKHYRFFSVFQILVSSHTSWSDCCFPPCCLQAWNVWCIQTEHCQGFFLYK